MKANAKLPKLQERYEHLRRIEVIVTVSVQRDLRAVRNLKLPAVTLKHDIADLRYLRAEVDQLALALWGMPPLRFAPIVPDNSGVLRRWMTPPTALAA